MQLNLIFKKKGFKTWQYICLVCSLHTFCPFCANNQSGTVKAVRHGQCVVTWLHSVHGRWMWLLGSRYMRIKKEKKPTSVMWRHSGSRLLQLQIVIPSTTKAIWVFQIKSCSLRCNQNNVDAQIALNMKDKTYSIDIMVAVPFSPLIMPEICKNVFWVIETCHETCECGTHRHVSTRVS